MDIKNRILKNGFNLFLIPLLFNIPFTSKLPLDYFFSKDKIQALVILEILFRIILIIYSLFMLVKLESNPYLIKGIYVYSIGVILYFTSWIILIVLEISVIENLNPVLRVILLFGPSYTPIIWLIGMALICNDLKFIIPSILFIFFHILQFSSIFIY